MGFRLRDRVRVRVRNRVRMGHDCAWMGVGASKLLESAATTPGTKEVLSNDRLHGGSVEASPSSPAVICSFARYANSSSSPLPSAAAEATGAPTALAAFFAAFAAALPAALVRARVRVRLRLRLRLRVRVGLGLGLG